MPVGYLAEIIIDEFLLVRDIINAKWRKRLIKAFIEALVSLLFLQINKIVFFGLFFNLIFLFSLEGCDFCLAVLDCAARYVIPLFPVGIDMSMSITRHQEQKDW